MNIIKRIKCDFIGHDIDPDESIINFIDKHNYLCKCHRCGFYVAQSTMGPKVVISEKRALEWKDEFEAEMAEFRATLNRLKEEINNGNV